jgi:hypothetical protein
MNNVATILVLVESSGNAGVYFRHIGCTPRLAQPLAAFRYPTHVDMVAKALEVAARKLGEGNFNPDVEISTPESRARKSAELMARG